MVVSMQDVEVLRAACCIAAADGEVRDVEADYLCRLASRLGVGQASLDAMTDVARSDQEFFEQQFQILKEQPLDSMKVLIRLALVDGAISREEGKMLQAFAQRLNVSLEQCRELIRTVQADRPGKA